MSAQEPLTILIAFNVALGLAAFFGGWTLRSITARLDKLETTDQALTEAITALRIALPTNYVAKSEHIAALDAIHSAIRDLAQKQSEALLRIENKLDGKADK